jgi:hypothetical protein
MGDVLPIRPGGLLDRHACFQGAGREILQHRIGKLPQMADPDGAVVLRRRRSLRCASVGPHRRHHRTCARGLEKVTSVQADSVFSTHECRDRMAECDTREHRTSTANTSHTLRPILIVST